MRSRGSHSQEHSARDRRTLMGVQVKVLEKRIDSLLQHWRTRVGLDHKVCTAPPASTPAGPLLLPALLLLIESIFYTCSNRCSILQLPPLTLSVRLHLLLLVLLLVVFSLIVCLLPLCMAFYV